MKPVHSSHKQPVSASGSNFYYSFLFLPPRQRAALTAIYAFCREVDDIVDETSEQQIAERKLLWWSTEIDRIFNGVPQHPIGQALVPIVKEFALQRVWFDEVLQGMAMDLRYQGYQTFEDLRVYCHCVASAVGMLAATVFGYSNSQTLEYAKTLGIAFQLVNIIRDIGEDARRGRIYIPEQELQQFGVAATEILELQIKDPAKFNSLLASLTQQARGFYQTALQQLPQEDRARQRSGLIMAKIYFSILEEVERSKFAVLNQKISITPLRKLWIAWSTMRAEKKLCRTLSS